MMVWKNSLWNVIQDAAEEEYDIARRKNHLDEYGNGCITVCLDGGWSKRSYGHSYSANSGVAVIIGKDTGKLLFLGVRNRYCSICERAKNREENPKGYLCFKNWNGSSASMEQDIIVEGFNKSIPKFKLKYVKFIADGDSSVYNQIKERVSYGMQVQKNRMH